MGTIKHRLEKGSAEELSHLNIEASHSNTSLMPDITVPGVNILAAYSLAASASNLPSNTHRRFCFNVLQGTSMSCPHIAGIAGLLKTRHPNWSPVAIKSVIMTIEPIEEDLNQPSANEDIVTQLVSMGFIQLHCQKAAINTLNTGVEKAMNWLLSHMDDPDIDNPISKGYGSDSVDQSSVNTLISFRFPENLARKAMNHSSAQP